MTEYYHKSKQFYLKRDMTYKNTLTIIRQLMNSLCIPFTSKIIYNKSKYTINYIIYLNDEIIDNYHNYCIENDIDYTD